MQFFIGIRQCLLGTVESFKKIQESIIRRSLLGAVSFFLIFLKIYISAQFIKGFVAVSKGFLFTKNIFRKSVIRRSLLGAVSF